MTASFGSLAREAVLRAGRPMHLTAIYAEVERHGIGTRHPRPMEQLRRALKNLAVRGRLKALANDFWAPTHAAAAAAVATPTGGKVTPPDPCVPGLAHWWAAGAPVAGVIWATCRQKGCAQSKMFPASPEDRPAAEWWPPGAREAAGRSSTDYLTVAL